MAILSGKKIADAILAQTCTEIEKSAVMPGLGIVLVGNDRASALYVALKEKRAGEIGIRVTKKILPLSATEDEVIQAVRSLNDDISVHGIIVQLPLPAAIDADRVIATLDPNKDADGFLGGTPVFPEAILELARSASVPLSGKQAVILARSERFGESMKGVLEEAGMKAAYTTDPQKFLPSVVSADVVVTALGEAGIVRGDAFKKGAIVIDGGIARKDGKTVGDVAKGEGESDIFLSPVPGGVGPVTVACLLRRVARLAINQVSR